MEDGRMHIGRFWPILFFQDVSLVEDNVMSFVDSGAEIGFSYRLCHHFCMFVAGKVGGGTDDAVVDIAFSVNEGTASGSSSDKLHVLPRRADGFAVRMLDTICGARFLE